MNRRQLRENVFKLLFHKTFYDLKGFEEQTELYLQYADGLEEASDQDKEFIEKKAADIVAHLEEIDALIEKVSQGWKLERMGRADLTLIRLAYYEIKYEEGVPVKVAINEALEIAKKYGQNDSASFINGILARLIKDREGE